MAEITLIFKFLTVNTMKSFRAWTDYNGSARTQVNKNPECSILSVAETNIYLKSMDSEKAEKVCMGKFITPAKIKLVCHNVVKI